MMQAKPAEQGIQSVQIYLDKNKSVLQDRERENVRLLALKGQVFVY